MCVTVHTRAHCIDAHAHTYTKNHGLAAHKIVKIVEQAHEYHATRTDAWHTPTDPDTDLHVHITYTEANRHINT